MSISESGRIQFRGSTALTLLALLFWFLAVGQGRFYPQFANTALNPTALIVYLLWPVTTVTAAVWSGGNLLFTRKSQFAVELILALLSAAIFYYLVIQAAQGV